MAELENTQADPSEAEQHQQVIAELESKLQSEKERADASEAAGSALQERVAELESIQEKTGDGVEAENAKYMRLNEIMQSEMEQLMEDISVKQEYIRKLEADLNAGKEETLEVEVLLNKLKEEASGQKEYILQLEGNLSDVKDRSSKVEEEFHKEKLELEASLREKIEHTNDLEGRISTVQEEHAKLESSLKEKDSQLQELAGKSADAPPMAAVMENDDEVSTLQEKQKETMHKLKAAVAKGKSIQKKLGLKEVEFSKLQDEHTKLLKQLQEMQEREKKNADFSLQGGIPVQSGFEPQQGDGLPTSDPDPSYSTIPLDGSEDRQGEGGGASHFDETNSSSFDNNNGGWGSGWGGQEEEEAIPRGPQDVQREADRQIQPDHYAEGDSEDDEEDIKIDQALKSAGASLWNWVSGE